MNILLRFTQTYLKHFPTKYGNSARQVNNCIPETFCTAKRFKNRAGTSCGFLVVKVVLVGRCATLSVEF